MECTFSALQADDVERDFMSSRTFKGAKPGFVFKTGSKGTGYYRDVVRAQGSAGSKSAGTARYFGFFAVLLAVVAHLSACSGARAVGTAVSRGDMDSS